jgi:cytochrome c553
MWLVLAIALLIVSAAVSAAESRRQELSQAMRTRPDYQRGFEIYRHCVSCHGTDAGGDVNGSVPRIAGQHYRVLLKQLVDYRHGERWDVRMEEIARRHALEGAQALADVALYVASQDRNGERGMGNGEFLELGQRLYVDRCQRCHGERAEGDDGKLIPRLAGQHYGYLLRQMYDAVDGRRPSMLRSHSPRIVELDFQQVRGLADFLSRVDQPDSE